MTQGRWYNSLRVLTVMLMTLALFPLGAVAIYQTNRVAAEAQNNAQLALLAITGRAAKAEELLIERAFGAARVFATIAGEFTDNPDRCEPGLGEFVKNDPRYSFVGFLPLSGKMSCTSTGTSYDFSGWPGFDLAMQDQSPTIVVNTDAPLSNGSVFVISEPYEIGGQFGGFVSISIPHSGLPDTPERLIELGLVDLMTFNGDGDVLTSRSERDKALPELPGDRALQDLTVMRGNAFQAKNTLGQRRTYTVVPIEGSPATVIGVWRVDEGLARQVATFVRPWLFPVLMWFASMCVAMLSIYMLVLRHLTRLSTRMNAFANDRSIDVSEDTESMPNEVRALYGHFDLMINNLIRDEASLEDALRAKNVLVKEVHHRVKNNLQLISSIMNMQIRTAEHDETKSVLYRLQDRVLSLATIHRDLYQSQNGGLVNVGTLVSEVVEKSLEVAAVSGGSVDLGTDIDPVLLYPDQAVPLSLLVAEAMTNAMKYLGAADGQKPWIKVSMKQDGPECVLQLVNSVGAVTTAESTGLGAQLMDAFAIQLGARIETDASPDRFAMTVAFKVAEFEPETRDF